MPIKTHQANGVTRFWMVGLRGARGPKRRHKSLAIAAKEAMHLCAKYKATTFVVEVVGQYTYENEDGSVTELAVAHPPLPPRKPTEVIAPSPVA